MSAVAFQERWPDPEPSEPESWEDLGANDKRELLDIALLANPKLIQAFYSEALNQGVDPFYYIGDI